MTRDEATAELIRHAEILRGRGAQAAFVYGSTARDEATEDSDIDIFIDVEPGRKFSLLDLAGMQRYLTEELGVANRSDHAIEPASEVTGPDRERSLPDILMARRIDVVLEDILDAIVMIEDATSGYSRASFAKAGFAQRGVERLLEIISEAVRHVPDDVLGLRPEIAWTDIRAIGNLIRHEYWRVDPDIAWAVVTDDLPPLRAAIEHLLVQSRG